MTSPSTSSIPGSSDRPREHSMKIRTAPTARAPLALALLVLAACAAPEAEAVDTAVVELAPSEVAVAERTSLRTGVTLTGTLNPHRQAEVKAQVPGTVTGIQVERGMRLAAGQTMATISAEGIRSQAASAEAGVAAANSGVAQARRELESARLLHAAGALSDLDLQAVETAYESAQAQLATAEAQAAGAREQAGRTVVSAPFAGEVSKRVVNEGEAVNVGETLFEVVNSSQLELEGQVPVAQATRVQVGQRVEFTLDGYPGRTFTGTVAQVAPVADPGTRQVGVTMRLPNDDRSVIGGLFATGRVITGTAENAVVVPSGAVRGTNGDAYVQLLEGGTLQRRSVVVGEVDPASGRTSIADGIAAGDTVVVSPGEVTPGTRVRVGSAPIAAADARTPAGDQDQSGDREQAGDHDLAGDPIPADGGNLTSGQDR